VDANRVAARAVNKEEASLAVVDRVVAEKAEAVRREAAVPRGAVVPRGAAVARAAAIARVHDLGELRLAPSQLRYSKNTEDKAMDAFALLKADHERVAGILEEIEKTTERSNKGRERLFTDLKSELDLHAQIEEEIFYPALEESDETRDITLEAYEEHRLVKQLLSELESEPKDTEEWTAKFTVLKENIEHHVEEEEGEMFKKARKALSKEEIESLGNELQQAKQQGIAAGAR
jgi:Hemerythrin HHE cation binding domain